MPPTSQHSRNSAKILDELLNKPRSQRLELLDHLIRYLQKKKLEEMGNIHLPLPSDEPSYVNQQYRSIVDNPLTPINTKIGDLLLLIRLWRGRRLPAGEIKVAHLAEGLGAATGSILNWESASTKISLEAAIRWSAYMNVPLGLLDVLRPVAALEVGKPIAPAAVPRPSESAWLVTYSGKEFDLCNPSPEMVDAGDIAMALTRLNRFTGHTRSPYSVAQHTRLLWDFAPPELKPWVLLHDCAEAYVGDVAAPLKRLLGSRYAEIESRVHHAVLTHFGMDPADEPREAVRELDLQALMTERRFLVPDSPSPWGITQRPFNVTQEEFLVRYVRPSFPPVNIWLRGELAQLKTAAQPARRQTAA